MIPRFLAFEMQVTLLKQTWRRAEDIVFYSSERRFSIMNDLLTQQVPRGPRRILRVKMQVQLLKKVLAKCGTARFYRVKVAFRGRPRKARKATVAVVFPGCLVSFAHLLFDLILASKDILPRSLRPRVFSIGLAFPLQTHPQEHFASLFASANEGEAKSKPGNLAHSESKRRKA